jgi:hypothetical protein
LVYRPNPKHREPWQRGRKGSLCEKELTLEDAQRLLDESVPDPSGKKRYAVRNERAYAGAEARPGDWHGWPVGWVEVPPLVRIGFERAGKLSNRARRRFWDSH